MDPMGYSMNSQQIGFRNLFFGSAGHAVSSLHPETKIGRRIFVQIRHSLQLTQINVAVIGKHHLMISNEPLNIIECINKNKKLKKSGCSIFHCQDQWLQNTQAARATCNFYLTLECEGEYK